MAAALAPGHWRNLVPAHRPAGFGGPVLYEPKAPKAPALRLEGRLRLSAAWSGSPHAGIEQAAAVG